MKKRATALLLALLMILPMAGCGVRAQELTKDIEPQALDTTTDLTAGGEAVTAFALSLLRSERAATEGVLISPVSVLNALGMVANGAGGDTLKQLEIYRQAKLGEIAQLTEERKSQYKTNPDSPRVQQISTAIKELRQEERLCRKIAEQSLEVQQHLTEARRDRAEQQKQEQERARDRRPNIDLTL